MACPTEIKGKIAIIGSGLIGQNWAMIFAGAGYRPCLFDVDPNQLTKALSTTSEALQQYEEKGFLRGQGSAKVQADRISTTTSLNDCLTGAFYVQECVPENLDLKKKVFSDLDKLAAEDMIIASSSSCLCASMFADGLKHRENMLVAHPMGIFNPRDDRAERNQGYAEVPLSTVIPRVGNVHLQQNPYWILFLAQHHRSLTINPPYFVPLVEIVPAPFTKADVTQKVRQLMEEIGQSPITLRRESLGFALNRIQYACINECWNMYKTGLLSAEDIDKVCTDGLGLRYAFIGPLETMHLNANGIKDYCERYAQGAVNVQKEKFLQIPVLYDTDTATKIQDEFKTSLPLDGLQDRRKWRDSMLAGLAKFKTDSKKQGESS